MGRDCWTTSVTITESTVISGTVYDVAMEQARNRDWVRQPGRRPGARQAPSAGAARPTSSSGATSTGLTRREAEQGATRLLHALESCARPTRPT